MMILHFLIKIWALWRARHIVLDASTPRTMKTHNMLFVEMILHFPSKIIFGLVPTLRTSDMRYFGHFQHKMTQGVHPANLSNPVRNVCLPPPISTLFSTLPPCSAHVSRARNARQGADQGFGPKKSQNDITEISLWPTLACT